MCYFIYHNICIFLSCIFWTKKIYIVYIFSFFWAILLIASCNEILILHCCRSLVHFFLYRMFVFYCVCMWLAIEAVKWFINLKKLLIFSILFSYFLFNSLFKRKLIRKYIYVLFRVVHFFFRKFTSKLKDFIFEHFLNISLIKFFRTSPYFLFHYFAELRNKKMKCSITRPFRITLSVACYTTIQ